MKKKQIKKKKVCQTMHSFQQRGKQKLNHLIHIDVILKLHKKFSKIRQQILYIEYKDKGRGARGTIFAKMSKNRRLLFFLPSPFSLPPKKRGA